MPGTCWLTLRLQTLLPSRRCTQTLMSLGVSSIFAKLYFLISRQRKLWICLTSLLSFSSLLACSTVWHMFLLRILLRLFLDLKLTFSITAILDPTIFVFHRYENVILEYVEEHGDLWPDWSEEVRLFVAYLDRTWISKMPMTRNRARKDPLFKFRLWNKWKEVREDIPTTNNSNEADNNQWNRSTEPNASGLLSPTSYVKSPCPGKLFLIQPVQWCSAVVQQH